MQMNEKLLFQAFDLQRFDKSARLQAVIDKVHRRVEGNELSDDDLDLVAAAGIPQPPEKPGKRLI